MMEIGARPVFNSDHDIFRASVRKFFNEECVPFHDKWEEKGEVDRELWLKAGEQGLLGTDSSEEHHGIGGDFKDAAIVMEEQSYVNCSGPGFALHSQIVMPYISHYGTQEQIDKFMPAMTAVTNPTAKTKAHGISLFLVEEGMEGFKKGRKLKKMGLKAQDTAELFFEDVRLPASALLGKENHGFYMLMQELPQERFLIGVMATVNCEWMFETTRDYVKNRKAFGKTLSHLQTIQHRLAEMKTKIAITRSFTDNCLEMHNAGKLDGAMASMNKYWTTDLQNQVGYDCVQMHGGWGYMAEYPICKAYLDARVQPIYGGSNEIMKELIARTIVS